MPRASSGENRFPLGEPTRYVDVCSTSSRRRKSKLLGMAGVNAAAPLPRNGFGPVSLDQGCFGHSRRKPTTCLTNLEDMRDLEDQRSTKHSEALQEDIKDRCHLSSTWAVWAPGLRVEGCHPRSTSPTPQTGR